MMRRLPKDKLTADEFKKRKDELFPALYVNSIGIIQNIALAVLIQQLATASFPADWPTRLLVVGCAIASLASIVLVATEYSWFVLIVRQTTTYIDVAIPYILGAFEFAPLFYVVVQTSTDAGYWFMWSGFFAAWGLVSYFHAFTYIDKSDFAPTDHPVHDRTRTHIITNMILLSVLCVSELGLYFLYHQAPTWMKIAGVWLVALVLIAMLIKGRAFLLAVEDHFASQFKLKSDTLKE